MIRAIVKVDGELYSMVSSSTKDKTVKLLAPYVHQALQDGIKVSVEFKQEKDRNKDE